MLASFSIDAKIVKKSYAQIQAIVAFIAVLAA
jgi:hypothetical protein